jgi:hypothetical protein
MTRLNNFYTGSWIATGTNTYAATIAKVKLVNNKTYSIKFANANSGTSSFNLNAGGATPLKKYNASGTLVDLVTGDIWENQTLRFTYNGTNLILSSGGSSFALTNGNGTTANGTAVDVGGTATGNIDLDVVGNSIFFHGTAAGKTNQIGFSSAGGVSIYNNGGGTIDVTSSNGATSTTISMSATGTPQINLAAPDVQLSGNAVNVPTNLSVPTRAYVLGAKTFAGKQTFVSSLTTAASFNIPNGTTPTTGLVNGDVWGNSNHLWGRLNGITLQLDNDPSAGTVSSVASADGSITVTNPTSTVDLAVVKAPIWSTARNLAGNSVNGSANVAFSNKFIVQGTTDAGLSGAQFLGSLGTGIIKNTTSTGVLSIAVAGDFPTLNQSTTGSSATLTTPRTIGTVTGDATSAGSSFDGSANNTNALTLATVNSNVGSFGSATQSPTYTVNGKGLITAASNTTITPAVGSITGLGTGVGTWLGTPSYTNLTSALTGTSPWWLATGTTTITGNTTQSGAFTNTSALNGEIITQNAIATSGIPALLITPGPHTTLTASGEFPNFKVAASSQQWATGAITNQRFNYFDSPTMNFVGASTVTNAYGTWLEKPIAGTNATFTNNWALGVNGNIKQTADFTRDAQYPFQLIGTMNSSPTTNQIGAYFEYTTAGSNASFGQYGLSIYLKAGYTGSKLTQGLNFYNEALGTGTRTIGQNGNGNFGILGQSVGTGTGHRIGSWTEAGGGAVNVGMEGVSNRDKNGATNMGVIGIAKNDGTTPVQIAGFFVNGNTAAVPTTSATVIMDNGSYTNPVLLARVNATTKLTIDGTGQLGIGVTPSASLVHIATGTTTQGQLKFDATTFLTTPAGGVQEYSNGFYNTKNSGLRYGVGGSIFEAFTDAGNTSTTETDIHSYTTPANTLEVNGAQVKAQYGINFVNSTSTKQVKVYFGGTAIFDSGALTTTATGSVSLDVTLIRVSSTVIRYNIDMDASGVSVLSGAAVGELTALVLSNTNILKVTGTAAGAGAATNDIVLKLASGSINLVSHN